MKLLNELLKELGISKVKLAKYLGVSRQMIYNYLSLNSLDQWPKDKKMKMFMLLNINSTNEFNNIKVTSDYILNAENILNNNEFISLKKDIFSYDLKDLDKKHQQIIIDIVDIIKEQLMEDENGSNIVVYKYLYHFLRLITDIKELKYVLAYFTKTNGFISPTEFAFNKDEQTTFEGIMFQAMTLYNNGGASKHKIIEAHRRFIEDIEQKNEEKLSRTQELNTAKAQALKELGHTEINENNISAVISKIAEIQARKNI